MEYPVSMRVNLPDGGHEPDVHITDPQVQKLLANFLPDNLQRLGDFLSNGARLYKDYGTKPEYSTAEDDEIAEGTVANEIAGEEILQEMLENSRDSEPDPDKYDFALNKRVTSATNPAINWGYHENYLVLRDQVSITSEDLTLLGLHLATRGLYTGAGLIHLGEDGSRKFYIAQKLLGLTKDFSEGTTANNKPLVNTRDEPHADRTKYARGHVVCGDALMSPWAMRMALGTTSLTLGLKERGVQMDHLYLPPNHMHLMAKQVASDLTLEQTVTRASGKTIRPIDIQWELYTAALKVSANEELSPDEKWTLVEWEKALDDLEVDLLRLKDRSDAVLKLHMLNRKPDDAEKIDALFDSLDGSALEAGKPLSSYGLYFRKTVWKDWMPSAERIKDRKVNPPDGTRARARVEAMRRIIARGQQQTARVMWEGVELKDSFPGQIGNAITYKFKPHDVTLPDELLAKLLPRSR